MLQDLADGATIAGGISAVILVIPAAIAVWQYWRNSRTQRAQWLASLFERFYEGDTYRDVRKDLEWNSGLNIRASIQSDEYDPLEEKWTDYLNFFEFVAYLRESGELTKSDTLAMFQYWLGQLKPFNDYLEQNGYDKLVRFLRSKEDS